MWDAGCGVQTVPNPKGDDVAKAVGALSGSPSLQKEGEAQQDEAEAQRDVAAKEAEADKARAKADAAEADQRSHQ